MIHHISHNFGSGVQDPPPSEITPDLGVLENFLHFWFRDPPPLEISLDLNVSENFLSFWFQGPSTPTLGDNTGFVRLAKFYTTLFSGSPIPSPSPRRSHRIWTSRKICSNVGSRNHPLLADTGFVPNV